MLGSDEEEAEDISWIIPVYAAGRRPPALGGETCNEIHTPMEWNKIRTHRLIYIGNWHQRQQQHTSQISISILSQSTKTIVLLSVIIITNQWTNFNFESINFIYDFIFDLILFSSQMIKRKINTVMFWLCCSIVLNWLDLNFTELTWFEWFQLKWMNGWCNHGLDSWFGIETNIVYLLSLGWAAGWYSMFDVAFVMLIDFDLHSSRSKAVCDCTGCVACHSVGRKRTSTESESNCLSFGLVRIPRNNL